MKQLIKISLLGMALATTFTAHAAATQTYQVQTALEATQVEYPQGWRMPAARYGAEIVKNVKITMDDGVKLDADIAYPTDLANGKRAAGNFPVIVEHMPYERFGAVIPVNSFFAEHGYISMKVRARGTGKSEGEINFLGKRDGEDGKNIIDWAGSKLQGSDGKVALIGCSWPGAIALNDAAYAGKNSPLKAVIAACSGLENMSRQSWLNAGMPPQSFWLFDAFGQNLTGDTAAGGRFFNALTQDVLSGKDQGLAGGDYWRERGSAKLAENIVVNDVPVLLWAGWKGVVEMGAVRAYQALQNAYAGRDVFAPMSSNQPTSPKWQLIMGGWDHGQGLDMGLALEWFNTWVKGENTGLQNTQTPMHVFERGTDRWLNLKGFEQVEATQWQLASGSLSLKNSQSGSDTLRYAQPSDNDGTLSYLSLPLKDGATLSGGITATIYAKSSNQNMLLIGRLYDVAPNGTETLISRGAVLGSQHELDEAKSWKDSQGVITWAWPKLDKETLLEPNSTYRFDLALSPRQWGVQPNHRLRFELTTQTPEARCPKQGAMPKNDTEPCRLTKAQEASIPGGVYTVLYGKDTPSSLNLPQLPYKTFAGVKEGKLGLLWNESLRRIEKGDSAAVEDNLLPMDTNVTHPLVW
ncbi:CocE/NonD family hydrolase [Neisseria perflava]|uniref:CocE/NonD family hydrolase n=1 Tax=Neisseria perflava TaxID=33053 RepID=UPI0020A21AA1|nr:CocE/NonD family hydrolase [Neisseria perflava]MCP1661236.1 putative acyl esterase [Neisseria perflava]MCP1773267.1 putative acyl esterase [Neisseria perflava]